eukprot:6182901-Pleurochrysis_carterae.AAC.4
MGSSRSRCRMEARRARTRVLTRVLIHMQRALAPMPARTREFSVPSHFRARCSAGLVVEVVARLWG